MEYEPPSETTYTIYCKSGCPNCTKAKNLIKKENPMIVDCDDYLIEDKEGFLDFMRFVIGKEYKVFPMIFKNGQFIGGYNELVKDYEKKIQRET
jgi:glutaredoxin